MNHSDFCWNTRLLPKVKQAFAAIWQTDDLIVSYDAANVFRPWKWNPNWLTNSNWWHVDQSTQRGLDRVCVQGLVTYYDATADTGGLCVIPKSHNAYPEVAARLGKMPRTMDYARIPPQDPILQQHYGILVGAKAGDAILWDSRTIHCNTPALTAASTVIGQDSREEHKEIIRLCAYVCMMPRSLASEEVLESRKLGFISRVGTSHWPTKEAGHCTPGPDARVLAECPPDMLALVGYRDESTATAGTNDSGCVIQ